MASPAARWAIAVFANRESLAVIRRTLDAVACSGGQRTRIELLVNGNPGLATELLADLRDRPLQPSAALRIWSMALGDKANAWNQYMQRIWSGEELVFFIDGYARPEPDAITLLGDAMMADELAHGGTGLPSAGRTLAYLRQEFSEESGFHGNLCCIKGSFLARLNERGFAIPRGLYRTDSLMGAVLCYDLDPGPNCWDKARLLVQPQASWQTDPKRWWRWRDLKGYVSRTVRQARGELEKRACRDHLTFRRQRPEALLPSARAMVLEWAERCPEDFQAAMNCNPQAWLAMRQLRREPDPPLLDGTPQLVGELSA